MRPGLQAGDSFEHFVLSSLASMEERRGEERETENTTKGRVEKRHISFTLVICVYFLLICERTPQYDGATDLHCRHHDQPCLVPPSVRQEGKRSGEERGTQGEGRTEGEEGGSKVVEDVAHWTRRRVVEEGHEGEGEKNCKMVQIFVKMGPEQSRWMWRRTTQSVT